MTIPQPTPVALGANLVAPADGALPDQEAAKPLLVLGPSLGTSVVPLWAGAAADLAETHRVVGWELPGHGRGVPTAEPFALAELAEGVHRMARELQREAGQEGRPYCYAGVSVGGAVGLELALAHGEDLEALAVLCSGAVIGEARAWIDRAELVEVSGTPTQIVGSAQKWFAPGFLEGRPVVVTELLHSLQEADRVSYGLVCRALADYDVRSRLAEITVPVLTVAGAHDSVTGPEVLAEVAAGVSGPAESVVCTDAAHLAPAETPDRVAADLSAFFARHEAARDEAAGSGPASTTASPAEPSAAGLPDPSASRDRVRDEGFAVRREVLSDEHVDRARARTTEFTAPFQDFITRYAWGEIWTRPGLARTTRSAITLTAMIALGHWSEFEMHVRAAIRNGLTAEEIREVILQSAVYCGVPAANTAFGRAQQILQDLGEIAGPDEQGARHQGGDTDSAGTTTRKQD